MLLIDYKLSLELLFYFSDHDIVDDLLNVILKLKKGTTFTSKDLWLFSFHIHLIGYSAVFFKIEQGHVDSLNVLDLLDNWSLYDSFKFF